MLPSNELLKQDVWTSIARISNKVLVLKTIITLSKLFRNQEMEIHLCLSFLSKMQ